jgi:hypothetical protein
VEAARAESTAEEGRGMAAVGEGNPECSVGGRSRCDARRWGERRRIPLLAAAAAPDPLDRGGPPRPQRRKAKGATSTKCGEESSGGADTGGEGNGASPTHAKKLPPEPDPKGGGRICALGAEKSSEVGRASVGEEGGGGGGSIGSSRHA